MDGYARKEKLRIQILNRAEEDEHFHQDFELLYILEGNLTVKTGEKTTHMTEEDILVLNANKKHSLSGSDNILFVKLLISYELISDVYQSLDIIIWCDSTRDESESFEDLRIVLKKLLSQYLNTRGNTADFGHISLCYRIMEILTVNFLVSSLNRDNMSEKDRFESRILQINNYIRSNYNQPISLNDLADKLYLSNGYLSRFFKKNFGMSFAEYLANIRLYHAVDELLYSNVPITRIAYDNGFASVAIFNKSFKKAYGETPSVFRKKSKEQLLEKDKAESLNAVEKRLESFFAPQNIKQKKSQSKNLISACYSVQHKIQLKTCWKKLLNAGPAEDLLRSEVREHIILLNESLGFEYVRFWNIFSKQMLIDIKNPDAEYNFSRLDGILDFLIQQGIKPLIELGQKPRRIQKSVRKALYFEEVSPVFTELQEWQMIMEALMSHLINRYGQDQVDTWQMELWLDEQMIERDNDYNDYFTLFNLISKIVKNYSRKIKLGGCGIQTNFALNSTEKFLQKWNQQECRPDFISILNYAYMRGEEDLEMYSKRSTDNAFLYHGVSSVKKMMNEAGMEDIKLYVTEWNLTVSDRNYINDTCFKGAYIIKNILDIYGEIDVLGYFLGSDRVSEYFDSNALLHGGTGLLTKDGILKPAGFAFDFLNQLYGYYVGHSQNHLVTTDGRRAYGIICHNQKKLNYNYYFTEEDKLEKEHIWKYFEDQDGMELKIELKDLDNGLYQMKTYRMNEQSGSVLSIWGEMDYAKELSRSDIKYFRRVCEPKLMIQKVEVKKGQAVLEVQLEANEFAFIRFIKI